MRRLIISRRNGEQYTYIIDDTDYTAISKFTYHVHYNLNKKYAARWIGSGKNKTIVYLHQDIFRLHDDRPIDGLEIDHKDNNEFNNTFENLRACTRQQNMFNRKGSSYGTSKYKGVSISPLGKITVTILNPQTGEKIRLSHFPNEMLAAKCYDVIASEFHGEFARLNFSSGK